MRICCSWAWAVLPVKDRRLAVTWFWKPADICCLRAAPKSVWRTAVSVRAALLLAMLGAAFPASAQTLNLQCTITPSTMTAICTVTSPSTGALLLQNGTFLLLENGGHVLLF
jgi:hypothetical protein